MPQLIEFPPIGADPRASLAALIRVCKDVPEGGEPFREFRSRLRGAKLWDKQKPITTLRFFAAGGATVAPSAFMRAVAAAATDEAAQDAVLDRLWAINPLLGKTILDLVNERPYGKDEIYKYLGSTAFKGTIPSRPQLEIWLQLALVTGLLRSIGIAVAKGPRFDPYLARAGELDVDEFLAEDRAEPEPVIPAIGDDETAAPGAVAEAAAPESSIPVAAAAPVGSVLPSALRHVAAAAVDLPPARGRDKVVPVSRFAAGFSDEILDETTQRIAGWWGEVKLPDMAWKPSDFGLDPEQWVEGADEVVYRIAVAAALAFRLEADRTGVIRAFAALDRAGVLADLYHGTVPESLPAEVDARALMLASLAARRVAETPDLAAQLDAKPSAADIFTALEAALGRGLFRIELLWMMDMLAKLGVIPPHPDLADFTVTPYRIVRDTLFRLGFIASPYAPDAATLAVASRAARRAAGPGPADEILAAFTVAAGCAYDCPHRKACDYPCRERTE
jgi:hypothetical protein